MVKTSRLIWYAGLTGVVASGALNALFLVESLHRVTIQVPSHTLEPYQTIGTNDVTTRQISAKDLDTDAVTGNLVGRVTAMTIPQGDQVQSFELAKQGSMAQVIQHLYMTHPNLSFAQIQVQSTQFATAVQPGQHISLSVNGITYPNVWVLSVTDASGNTSSIGSQVSQAVSNFVNINPSSQSGNSSPLTFMIGAPWPTVQALMSSANTQVVMGNVGATQYSLGSPPVNQNQSTTTTLPMVNQSPSPTSSFANGNNSQQKVGASTHAGKR